MPFSTGPTGCRHHEQDKEQFCGEAAEMMIAANQQPALLGPGFTQNGLASLRTGGTPRDFTTPPDVRDVLQRLLPAPHRFSLQQRTTREEAMADVIFALKSNQVPVATRISTNLHWVVVWGVQTDVEPVPGNNYSVELVYCNNPKLLTTPPNPHSAVDICPLHARAGVQSVTVIRYSEWCDHYFLGDPNAGGQFVVVLDAKTPGSLPALAAYEPAAGPLPPPVDALQRDIGPPRAPVPPTPQPGPLTQAGMVDESRMALAAMQLPGSAPRSALDLMDGAEPGAAIRIQQQDRAESHYFLVPWTLGGKLVMTIQIDGATGRFVSAQFHDGRWFSDLGSTNQEVVLGQLSRLQQIDVYTAAVQPTLIWRPSLESSSPHFPFVQVTGRLRPDKDGSLPPGFPPTAASGSQQLFVRLDGSIFPSLRDRQ